MRFVIYLASLLTLAGLLCLGEQRSQEARAQVVSCTGSVGVTNVQSSVPCTASTPTGSCSQSTAWFARASSLDTTHHNAYDALICGGVTDGWWAKTDALWIARTNLESNYILNLVSTSFTLSKQGSTTFTADAGIAGDGSTGYYKTGYTLGTSGTLRQDTASLSVCATATYSATANENAIGGVNAGGTIFDEIVSVGGANIFGFMSNGTFASQSGAAPGTRTLSRTGSTTLVLYYQGSSAATDATASVGNPGVESYLMARDNNGTPDNFTATQHAVFQIGSGFSSTDASNFRTRFQTYAAAIGSGGPC